MYDIIMERKCLSQSSGPPSNILFDHFIVGDIQNPTIAIIMTIIAMTWLTLTWYWYVKEKKEFKKYEKKKYFR